jgi:hypothetical protein
MDDRHQKVRDALEKTNDEEGAVGYILLWLIGVPIPILLLLWLVFR